MEQYKIQVIKSFDQWRTMREDWNNLIHDSAFPNIFMSWEWLSAWSEVYIGEDRSLFVIAVFDKKELISVAPFCIRNVTEKLIRIKQLEFLGTPEIGSDYLDVPMKRGKEKAIVNAIYDFICRDAHKEWDKLWLNDIPSNSLFLTYLLEIIKFMGKYSQIDFASYCPVSQLVADEEALIKSLSSSWRKKYKQDIRNLNKMGNVRHLSYSLDQLPNAVTEFFKLYKEKTIYNGDPLLKQINNFIKSDNGKKSVQIDLLKTDNQVIAGILHLRFNDTLYLYLMAIDKEFNPKISLGNLLVGYCITNAIKSGLKYYDFLKGTENYKFHWANFGKSSISISYSQRNLKTIFNAIIQAAKVLARLLLR